MSTFLACLKFTPTCSNRPVFINFRVWTCIPVLEVWSFIWLWEANYCFLAYSFTRLPFFRFLELDHWHFPVPGLPFAQYQYSVLLVIAKLPNMADLTDSHKIVSVECIHVNGLSTACQSGFWLKKQKTWFLHNHLIFSHICLDERSCLDQYIYLKIKIYRKLSVSSCTVTLKEWAISQLPYACVKTSLHVERFIWKCFCLQVHFMQIKVIFIWNVLYKDPFLNVGTR